MANLYFLFYTNSSRSSHPTTAAARCSVSTVKLHFVLIILSTCERLVFIRSAIWVLVIPMLPHFFGNPPGDHAYSRLDLGRLVDALLMEEVIQRRSPVLVFHSHFVQNIVTACHDFPASGFMLVKDGNKAGSSSMAIVQTIS